MLRQPLALIARGPCAEAAWRCASARTAQRRTRRNLAGSTSRPPPTPDERAPPNGDASAASRAAEERPTDEEALELLAERGRAVGMRLSLSERRLIASEADRAGDGDGRMSCDDWNRLVERRSRLDDERLTISEYLTAHHDSHLGQNLLDKARRCAVFFFAICGAHAAGEAGMHVFGSVVVGCLASLGGGTINNLMLGTTPVGWLKDPKILMAAVAASVGSFYVWPIAERLLPIFVEDDGAVDDDVDDKSSSDEEFETRRTPRWRVTSEAVRYAIESVALGAFAVVGAQSGIVRGLRPVASAALGVTIAFGGIMRDVVCQRRPSLTGVDGCQSYALASFSGSAVYVALRELHVWNCAGSTAKLVKGGLPIGLRIVAGAGTAVAVRVFGWFHRDDGIFAPMDACAEANYNRFLRRWVER